DVIATDGNIPAIMDAGGMEGNPAEYILGETGAYSLSYGSEIRIGDTTAWNELIIRNGSEFSVTGQFNMSVVGYNTSSSGTVTVTGSDSTWSNSHALVVGRSGSGKVTVENGATITGPGSTLGALSGSDGKMTVKGDNSHLST